MHSFFALVKGSWLFLNRFLCSTCTCTCRRFRHKVIQDDSLLEIQCGMYLQWELAWSFTVANTSPLTSNTYCLTSTLSVVITPAMNGPVVSCSSYQTTSPFITTSIGSASISVLGKFHSHRNRTGKILLHIVMWELS